MSTRSKAKATAATSSTRSVPTKAPNSKADAKPKGRGNKAESEKENVKNKAGSNQKPIPSKRKSLRSSGPVYCTCQKGNDGTPMVRCEECKLWYHFSCVDLDEADADDIHIYICPACHQASGLRTVYYYEGPEAVEEVKEEEPPALKKQKQVERDSPPLELPSESEGDLSSADEYVAEEEVKPQSRAVRRRSTIHISDDSDSENLSDSAKLTRRSRFKKRDTSPLAGSTKRKAHVSSTPPPKRKRTELTSVAADPARKYCLTKLEEVFQDVFLKYHHVRSENQEGNNFDGDVESDPVPRPLDDLTDEERAALMDESKQFAAHLEQAVFEIYSEPDKLGLPHAGPKYKDRFRMLQFNLSKPDRVVLHQRIVGGLLPPKEIAVMSSTDLASEEAKQSIKLAEKEALEHSILVPTTVPRAKITHKGLEDIEVVHETSSQQDERAQLLEQEERLERERMARLRAQTRARTESVSLPPESPVVPLTPSWAGPSLALHAMSPVDGTMSPLMPMGSPTAAEPEINLSDFINIDEEMPLNSEGLAQVQSVDSTIPESSEKEVAAQDKPTSPVTLSPSTSFDLNTLWSRGNPLSTTPPNSPPVDSKTLGSPAHSNSDKDMSIDSEGPADDHDFDMFLDDKPEPANTSAEAQQAILDAFPQVWSGKISMPLDSTIPRETPVVARQVGGRQIPQESGRWKVLFPAELFNIEGRVPIESSSKFLIQTRLANLKELVAVAFSPANQENDVEFRVLSDFLIAKGRHGLIFPWGSRPKDHLPGRELYIVPLLSSDPIPDFLELLDDLRLPKLRKNNVLIGIWVLNKGKWASPPPSTPSTQTSTPSFPSVPSIPIQQSTPTPPQDPSKTAPFATTSAPSSTSVPALPLNIIAEVATLTPEQIQMMIQTLQGSGSFPLPAVPPQPQAAPPPPIIPQLPVPQVPPPHPSMTPVAPPPHQWSPPPPIQGYPQMYPPPSTLHGGPPPPPHQLTPPFGQQYRRESWDRPSQSPPRGDRNDRGGRTWRGSRGRGRGHGHDRPASSQEHHRSPVDNGWPRKPSRGGPPGQSAPRW